MITVLPETGVPEGATLAVALEWPGARPSLDDLRKIWWRDTVATMPNLPVSNAIIRVSGTTTGAKIAHKAQMAGATKVFVWRFEDAELPKDPGPDFDPRGLAEELKRLARAFAIPGVIIKPPPGENGDSKPFLESPKKVAIALAFVGGLTGLTLVAIHFARRSS